MKTLLRTLLLSAFLIQGLAAAPAEEDGELLPSMLKLLNTSYSVSFRYVVSTGFLAEKIVEFKSKGNKFCFKWLNSETGEIHKMYAFDGERYYQLQDEGMLSISVDPASHATFAATWFAYNPIYAPYKYLIGNISPFAPAGFSKPETELQLKATLGKLNSATGDVEMQAGKSKVAITFSKESPMPCKVRQTMEGEGELTWTARDFVKLPGSAFSIPAEIVCREMDLQNNALPSSFSITLDKDSIKPVPDDTPDTDFRVPMSIANSVYDSDRKIYLKELDRSR